MTQYQVKYQERLEYAMSKLVIYRDFGMYALVPSTSAQATYYIVDINPETLYSEKCECEAGSHDMDCVHRLAVDRYLDAERWNKAHGFKANGLELIEEEQASPAPTTETVSVESAMAEAQAEMEQFEKVSAAEKLLLELDTVEQELRTATGHDIYECCVVHSERIQKELREMGYPPMLTVRGWALRAY